MVGAALPNSIINNKPLHPHHSNIFDFDEKAMMVGLKFWLSLVDEL
jgi:metal-dependent amidase/aminoacylase/carboxypeptidase family protein